MKDMHKIAIIGNGSVGTCLTEKIKDLDKEITVVQNIKKMRKRIARNVMLVGDVVD